MKKPIKLVLLLEDLDFGGTQRYALHLATHFNRDCIQAEIWTMRGGHGFKEESSEIEINHLTQSRRVSPFAIIKLFRSLKKMPPDVLYTLTALPNIWGRLAAAWYGIPLVSGYRSMSPGQHERILHRLSQRIIANAPQLARILTHDLGVPEHKVVCIPNGVDLAPLKAREEKFDAPLIVCVARRVPIKDLPTLVEAFKLVRKNFPLARLQIIGDGPVKLDANVPGLEILPGSSSVHHALSQASIFALSSLQEGAPNAILEAMAHALPVVATDVGGIPDIVINGETGILVPASDPDAMSSAICRLLKDPEHLRAMGRAGRVRVETFYSISSMVNKTAEVLKTVAIL